VSAEAVYCNIVFAIIRHFSRFPLRLLYLRSPLSSIRHLDFRGQYLLNTATVCFTLTFYCPIWTEFSRAICHLAVLLAVLMLLIELHEIRAIIVRTELCWWRWTPYRSLLDYFIRETLLVFFCLRVSVRLHLQKVFDNCTVLSLFQVQSFVRIQNILFSFQKPLRTWQMHCDSAPITIHG